MIDSPSSTHPPLNDDDYVTHLTAGTWTRSILLTLYVIKMNEEKSMMEEK